MPPGDSRWWGVWLANCDGTRPGGRIAVDRLAWNRFKRPADQERRVVLERPASRGGIGLRVGGDVVDDDAGPRDDRNPQVDLELVALAGLVQRSPARGRIVGVHAAESERDDALRDVDIPADIAPVWIDEGVLGLVVSV